MIKRDNESGEALCSITDWAVHTSKRNTGREQWRVSD